jgi:subtilisin family serine protease
MSTKDIRIRIRREEGVVDLLPSQEYLAFRCQETSKFGGKTCAERIARLVLSVSGELITPLFSDPFAGVYLFARNSANLTSFPVAQDELFPDVRKLRGSMEDPEIEQVPVFHFEGSCEPWVPTGNLIVSFSDGTTREEALDMLRRSQLYDVSQLHQDYPIFVARPLDSRFDELVKLAERLMKEGRREHVETAYPELVCRRDYRGAHPHQWNLMPTRLFGDPWSVDTGVTTAWKAGYTGKGITIAVIDEGFDLQHPEFSSASPDAPKVVHSRAFSSSAEQLAAIPRRRHGTWCAAVACARGLDGGSAGVAPDASLMPIAVPRSELGLGSVAEAMAFFWVANHGADIISCSWGAPSLSRAQIPLHTEAALRHAATKGRNGLGCAVVFASGNTGTELQADPYASSPHGIAIGACLPNGTPWEMNGYGGSLFCCFPGVGGRVVSTGRRLHVRTADFTPGVSASGTGYYFDMFNMTSAAAAGMAGVLAIVMQKYPHLGVAALRRQLRNGMLPMRQEASGPLLPHGQHSIHAGYGLLNAYLTLQ